MADRKTAGYLCTGCGIGERLDPEQLALIATRDGKIESCKQHPMLCSVEGVQTIRDDISAAGVSHVLIAACSHRAKVEAFNFSEVAVARANLREGVIWARPDGDEHRETSQDMADDYVRMAAAELRTKHRPAPSGEQGLNRRILVVGGGVTGMSAALESAAAGYQVHLVEKTGALGGHAAALYKRVPFKAASGGAGEALPEAEEPGVEALVEKLNANGRITVHLNAKVAKTSGAPGRFSADITTESGSTTTENFGAIIQASGFEPYDAAQLPEFAYGKTPDVVTNFELERLAKEANGGPIRRPSDGREAERVIFVQCAGQRSSKQGHLAYCSGFCCSESLKQAIYFKDQNPGCDTTVLFDDLRTPGAAGEDFYRLARQKSVTFARGRVSEVALEGNGLTVRFKDLILNQDSETPADLVVLATGMVANSGPDPYALPTEAEHREQPAREVAVPVDSILNLDYSQGTDLPHLQHGLVDSHFVCFPYETRRTGIYAAGPVRRPMDMKQAIDDAAGAAMKAIQSIENAAGGAGVHPRTGDLSFPSLGKEGCTQCGRCTVECPFGAIDEDRHKQPVFNESRCRRCGICMGACPVQVISFDNYSVETVGAQIKNCDVPDEFDEKPRILVLACENDAYPALDQATMSGREISPWARIIPVRCLGSVSMSWVIDAVNSGYDGVVLMGCRRDQDYQCHFVRGSAMAAERMTKVGDTLQVLNLEPERVAVHEVAITDIERAPRLIQDMADVVEKLGMNPFKF